MRNNNFASQVVSSLFVNGYVISDAPSVLSKSGKIVALSMYVVAIGNTTYGTTILTLPIEFRPTYMRYCDVAVSSGGLSEEETLRVRLVVNTDGVVKLNHDYTHKATHAYLMGTLMFSI